MGEDLDLASEFALASKLRWAFWTAAPFSLAQSASPLNVPIKVRPSSVNS
jgi:hypothetical protein